MKVRDFKDNWFEKIKKLVFKNKLLFGWGLVVVSVLIPQLVQADFIKGTMVKILLYMLLASSLNIINGYSGQFNIGHAGFCCIGAYTAGILATRFGLSFWSLLVIAGIVTAVVGFLISLPTLKMKGMYLAIVTLGFSEIVRLVALNWIELTGGPMGVKGIPSPKFFSLTLNKTADYYYIALFLVIVCMITMRRIVNSRVGRAWIAIREDESAAQSHGVETNKFKSINFVFGAFWAGVGGCFIAFYYHFISSDMFTLDEGFNILSMVIIGGQGTLAGPLVGSFIVNLLTEVFRFAQEFRMVLYALLIILMMWIRPQGLAGASKSILGGGTKRKVGKKKVVVS
jgi:branched-chain amino acid transport system permease protein